VAGDRFFALILIGAAVAFVLFVLVAAVHPG
jgi:hypothetical protein